MRNILLYFMLVIAGQAFSQNINLKRTVTDAETKEPVAGTNIIIKGKLAGTITDEKSTFALIVTENIP